MGNESGDKNAKKSGGLSSLTAGTTEVKDAAEKAIVAHVLIGHLWKQTEGARAAIANSKPVTFFGSLHRFYLNSVMRGVPETLEEKDAFNSLREKFQVDKEDMKAVMKFMDDSLDELDPNKHANRRRSIERIVDKAEYMHTGGCNRK